MAMPLIGITAGSFAFSVNTPFHQTNFRPTDVPHYSRVVMSDTDAEQLLADLGTVRPLKRPPHGVYAIEPLKIEPGFHCQTCGKVVARRRASDVHACRGPRNVVQVYTQRPFRIGGRSSL